MDISADVKNLLAGVLHAQSSGSYTLEEAEQLASVVRRVTKSISNLTNTPLQLQQPVQPQSVPVPVPTPSIPLPQSQPLPQPVQPQPPTQSQPQQLRPSTRQIQQQVQQQLSEPLLPKPINIQDSIEAISLPIQ